MNCSEIFSLFQRASGCLEPLVLEAALPDAEIWWRFHHDPLTVRLKAVDVARRWLKDNEPAGDTAVSEWLLGEAQEAARMEAVLAPACRDIPAPRSDVKDDAPLPF